VKPLVLHINYIPRQFDPIALSKGNYAELLNILPWKVILLLKKKYFRAISSLMIICVSTDKPDNVFCV
jgi:hypothetical protein